MKLLTPLRPALAFACAACLPLAHATPVPSGGGLFDLGLFAAGSYVLTGSGLIDICGGGSAVIRPDGRPETTVSCGPLAATFNPDGSYFADGNLGRAGFNGKIGALVGTLNAAAYTGINPGAAQSADWFLIGYATTITLATASHIYASINDTFYPDNSGSFAVDVQATGGQVPEPASLALVVLALGGLSLVRPPRAAGRRWADAV